MGSPRVPIAACCGAAGDAGLTSDGRIATMSGLDIGKIHASLAAALSHRHPLIASTEVTAYRLVDGSGDGMPGLYLDRLGPVVILAVYEDARLSDDDITVVAKVSLDLLAERGIDAVYVKQFVRDRSRLGGVAPAEARSPAPRAGRPQPATLLVREYASQFEVKPYDGFSTGLFLEHREHRRYLGELQATRALNLFAYTCAFAVPLAAAGTEVVNVDVSANYLAWGRRNLELNPSARGAVRFVKMDAREYLAFAARRGERFDLVIVDPPTFAAADPRRKRRAWKSAEDYPELLQSVSEVLMPGGRIFAATNNRELAAGGEFARLVSTSLGSGWTRATLPPWPVDVRERGRVAAVCLRQV